MQAPQQGVDHEFWDPKSAGNISIQATINYDSLIDFFLALIYYCSQTYNCSFVVYEIAIATAQSYDSLFTLYFFLV